jgi:RNA ligase (TIGR02306 family)
MLKIQEKDSNYLAKIDVIKEIRKHNNADKLQIITIDGNNVITDLSSKVGDRIVYCPIESQLSDKFLNKNNLYEEKTLNSTVDSKGYFNKQGRVRCISLRGEKSEGVCFPISLLENTYNIDLSNVENEQYFDTINNELFIKKYLPPLSRNSGTGKQQKKENVASTIVEGQFNFHTSTPNLEKCINSIDLNNYVYITQKLHGTSAIFSKILCKKKFNLFQKILMFFGKKYIMSEYKRIYSSRTVIKSDNNNSGYYKEDIWKIVNNEITSIPDGVSVYGEIVGFMPSGQQIQKGYSYNCGLREHRFFVYRVTYTDMNGNVKEYDWNQLVNFCDVYALTPVPILWEGYLSTIKCDNLLEYLKKEYLEKDIIGTNGLVPDEGVVLSYYDLDSNNKHAFKLKSFKFKCLETKQADKNEVSIEDEN